MSIPGLPPWALPPLPPPLHDPPPMDPPLVQRLADGSYLALPMNLPDLWGPGYNVPGGWDDSQQILLACQQARGSGAIDTYLGGNGQTGGRVRLLANAVYSFLGSGQVPVPAGVWLEGGGRGTIIASQSSLTPIYAHGNQPGAGAIQGVGTKISGLTVDLSGAPSGATVAGIDFGDQYEIILEDVTVQNNVTTGKTASTGAQPTGAVGFLWHDAVTLTEKCFMRRCTVNNCGTPNLTATTPDQAGGAALLLVSTCSGGGCTASFMYSEIDLHINQQPGQNGVVLGAKGNWLNGRAVVRGNMNCPGSGNNGCAAIVIGVANPGGGAAQAAQILRMVLDIHVESDPVGSGATQPWTVYFGSNAQVSFLQSMGRMQFLDGFQASNMFQAAGNAVFSFEGRITGDTVLPQPSIDYLSLSSGVTNTNVGPPKMMTVSGGTVTQIQVNGVTSGLTSGTFFIPLKATYSITFSAAPTVTFTSMVST